MATKYDSKFTGKQIDNSVETVVSNTATEGQVLTANGTGGSTWQDPAGGGTEVVANPSLAGTESDLTGLEVAGTKYKVPTGGGTEVVANPSLAGTESDLTGLEVAGTKYKVPTGGSGGGTQLYLHTLSIFINSDKQYRPSFTVSFISNNSVPYDDTNFPQAKIGCSGSTVTNAIIQSVKYNGDIDTGWSFTFEIREPSSTNINTITLTHDLNFQTTVTPL